MPQAATPPDDLSPLADVTQIDTVNRAAERMLEDLELSVLSKRTYRHGLDALIRFLHMRRNDDAAADALAPCPLAAVDEETLYGFFRWLREAYPDPVAARAAQATRAATASKSPAGREALTDAALASRTARTYLVAAKRLMNWLDLHELLPSGVSYDRMVRRTDQGRGHRRAGYMQRKVDPEVTRVLTHYLRLPLPPKPGARRLALLRNRALMALLYDTGMRISEALALTRDDVLDGRAFKVRLTITKNRKPRTVFLTEETQRLIHDYVKERADGARAPLFTSHGRGQGGAITPSHAWLLVKQAAEAEGLYTNTSPHSLRHRRAQDLLDEGMPLEWVAALLGHQHPDTTRIVYAWETDEERLGDLVATYGLSPSEAQNSARERAGGARRP